jgi:hypothetical protein
MEASKLVNTTNDKDFLLSVILYTNGQPHIKKCLEDKTYWDALSENSGLNWKIYAIKPTQWTSTFDNPRQTMGLMIPIWKEPSANKGLLDFFGIESTERLPMIVLFDVKNNEINDSLILKIDW